jgi:hypothetical protein
MENNNQQNETLVAEQEFLSIGPSTNSFVFMEKTSKILEIGFSTNKNLVLYGPGE